MGECLQMYEFFFPPLIVQNIKVDVKKVVSPVKSEAKPDMNFTYKTWAQGCQTSGLTPGGL